MAASCRAPRAGPGSPGPLPPKGGEHPGDGESFAIFQVGKKRPLGHVDGHRALRECHPGAIYLHKAATFVVERLDLERRNIWVQPHRPQLFHPHQDGQGHGDLEILETRQVARVHRPHRPAQGHRALSEL
jgi:ATP-dependent helicase YprA (DUF1998 family)